MPEDVVVVLDEAYTEFVRDPDAVVGPSLLAEHPNLVVLRTFSKAYGLASLRVGYALAHPLVADALRATAVPFGVSGPAQAAAARLAGRRGGAAGARRPASSRSASRLRAALAAVGWEVPEPQGNFVWLAAGERTGDVVEACEAAGVTVRGFAGEGVRCSVGTARRTTCSSAPSPRSRPARDAASRSRRVRDRNGLKISDLPADTVFRSPRPVVVPHQQASRTHRATGPARQHHDTFREEGVMKISQGASFVVATVALGAVSTASVASVVLVGWSYTPGPPRRRPLAAPRRRRPRARRRRSPCRCPPARPSVVRSRGAGRAGGAGGRAEAPIVQAA